MTIVKNAALVFSAITLPIILITSAPVKIIVMMITISLLSIIVFSVWGSVKNGYINPGISSGLLIIKLFIFIFAAKETVLS